MEKSWNHLPKELKELVFNELLKEDNYSSRFAPVNNDWQHFFEKRNLRHLKLTAPRLENFETMPLRFKKYVECINLCIELQEYACPSCWLRPVKPLRLSEVSMIEGTLRKCLRALSSWERKDSLALDVNIYSPSDPDHCFKDIRIESLDSFDNDEGNDQAVRFHDPYHGWIDGVQRSFPSPHSEYRLLWPLNVSPYMLESLPRVKVVTSLLIRRQSRRQFNQKALVEFLRLFPNLEELCYEPWQGAIMDYQPLFDHGLPRNLRKCIIFQDFPLSHTSFLYGTRSKTTVGQAIASYTLARASLGFEHLAAAFLVDAQFLFQVYSPDWVWKRLTTLTLTCADLSERSTIADIQRLIRGALKIVRQMPKLKTMELWNGWRGRAALVRYERPSPNWRTLLWRATWDLPFEKMIFGLLRELKLGFEIEVKKEFVDGADKIRSHGDAIRALQLKNQALCQVSLRQICRESSFQFA